MFGKYIKRKIGKICWHKIIVFAAAVVWFVAAGNALWRKDDNDYNNQIISAFGSMYYREADATISASGYYGNAPMSDTGKEIVLEKIADMIGISRYGIEDVNTENRLSKILSQSGKNGDVTCEFVTIPSDDSSENYISVNIKLVNNLDSAETYKNKVENIMKELQIKTNTSLVLKGVISGKLSNVKKERVAEQILKLSDAKKKEIHAMDDAYCVYAYDKNIKDYIKVNGEKVNINICMTYNEDDDATEIYFATPINNADY